MRLSLRAAPEGRRVLMLPQACLPPARAARGAEPMTRRRVTGLTLSSGLARLEVGSNSPLDLFHQSGVIGSGPDGQAGARREAGVLMQRLKRDRMVMAGLLVLVLAGCQGANQQTAQQEAASSNSAASGSAGGAEKSRKRAEKPAAAAPQVETVTIPAGTAVDIRLTDAISSATATAGSSFNGTLAKSISVDGRQIAPVGASVSGQVTNAVSSGRLKRPAELSLTLSSFTPAGGAPVQISTGTYAVKGASHKKRDAELIGGGAGVGALIGAIAGRGKGAAIGGLVGAGAGTAGAAYTGKKEITLAPETLLHFTLTAPVTLTRNAS
jgi:hypothetical protein